MDTETIGVRRTAPSARLPGLVPVTVVARRVVRGALIWGGVFAVVIWMLVTQFAKEYPTAEDRARLVATIASNVGEQALFGPGHHLDTVAGYTAYHAVGFLGIIGAVWGLLAATRMLRGEEETGRWELLVAGATTRRRAAAGAMAGLGIGLATLWAVTAAALIGFGRLADPPFSPGAAMFAGLATVAGAAMFIAVGAVCSQLAATRRQAAGLAAAVLGVAYLLRLLAYSNTNLRWLHWASPLGWADELWPLTGNRALPLLPIAAWTIAATACALTLAGQRDLDAAVLSTRDTARPRTRLLANPLGLTLRLNLRTTLGWLAGLTIGSLVMGLNTRSFQDIWANQSSAVWVRLGGTTDGAAFLGMTFLVVTFLITMVAAGQVTATRDEEAEGYLDHLLARPASRWSWLAGRFVVAAGGLLVLGLASGLAAWIGARASGAHIGLATMTTAGLNVVPAGILVLGVGTLTHALVPRLATPVAYGLVAWSFLIELIGSGLGASRWLLDLSILHHVARAPAADMRWSAALTLATIGILAAASGAAVFTRRDLKGA